MLAIVFAFGMIAVQEHATDHAVLKLENRPIVLTGRIRLAHGYGPPGWGEDPKHDARIAYWVIDLPSAINTPCKPERPGWAATDCQSTKRLRLVIEDNSQLLTQAKAVHGRTARVTGMLHRQDTAGEITPIFMDQVTEISLLP